jgi:sec-independent protein translocase protein TatA
MGLDNPIHIAFLLVLVLLMFGAKRLPEFGRSLGTGMRGFRDSLSGTTAPSASEKVSALAPVEEAVVAPVEEAVVAPVEESGAPFAA